MAASEAFKQDTESLRHKTQAQPVTIDYIMLRACWKTGQLFPWPENSKTQLWRTREIALYCIQTALYLAWEFVLQHGLEFIQV